MIEMLKRKLFKQDYEFRTVNKIPSEARAGNYVYKPCPHYDLLLESAKLLGVTEVEIEEAGNFCGYILIGEDFVSQTRTPICFCTRLLNCLALGINAAKAESCDSFMTDRIDFSVNTKLSELEIKSAISGLHSKALGMKLLRFWHGLLVDDPEAHLGRLDIIEQVSAEWLELAQTTCDPDFTLKDLGDIDSGRKLPACPYRPKKELNTYHVD